MKNCNPLSIISAFIFLFIGTLEGGSEGHCGKPQRGPPGPAGLPFASDYAYYVVDTSVVLVPATGITPILERMPFVPSGIAPSSTNISLDTATNQIIIGATGSYYISFAGTPSFSEGVFGFSINGSGYDINNVVAFDDGGGGEQYVLSKIVNVTTVPTTISVNNFIPTLSLTFDPGLAFSAPTLVSHTAWIIVIKIQ